MPARKRVQGQQRRLRKERKDMQIITAAYGNDPAALEAREQQLEASLAKLDADLAKYDAVDDRPMVPDAEPDDEAERPSDAELAEAKATQRRRLTQMREDMASLLAVNRRIRAALEGGA